MSEPIDKETRGATNLRIKFRSANLDEFIERYSVDVSRGGIFIRTREPLSVGSRLKLDFQLLDAGPLLEGEGTVVWIRQPDPARAEVTPGMGVRFDKLSPESQTRLDRILSEKERLGQTGKATGLTKSSGGMAVRRPTGAFSTVDGAAKPLGTAPAAGADAKPPAGQIPTPPPPTAGAVAPRTTSVLSSQARPTAPASGFGRPRTTSGGMSTLRAPPVPSGLFEAPTADDIDKALSVLEEKPGPVPPMPPPPAPRLGADVPIEVADDASNEPTRVVSDPQEFAANEAVTGNGGSIIPESGVPELAASALEDMTAPASADDEATMAASPAAFAAAERALGAGGAPEKKAASLDAPLGAHLQTPAPVVGPPPMPLRKKGIIVEAASPTESGRFRTNATYRRPNKSGKRIVAVLVLVAAGGAAFKFRDRLRKMIPTSSEVATAPVPPAANPTPNPSVTPEAGVNAAAADAAIAAAMEGPAAPMPPAPAPESPPNGQPEKGQQERGQLAKGQPEKHAADKPTEEDRPRRRKVQHAAAAEPEAGAAGDKAAAADKPAEEKAAPADKPVEVVTPGGDAPAPPSAETPPAAAAPMLKVTSSPAGAEVIIDGNSVGTTPFSSKDIDPAAAHAITLKKDGYQPQERAITAGDWSRLHGGALKVSIKLRRSAPAAKAPAEEKKEANPEVEILTPDSP